jgi:hypothetical protein
MLLTGLADSRIIQKDEWVEIEQGRKTDRRSNTEADLSRAIRESRARG